MDEEWPQQDRVGSLGQESLLSEVALEQAPEGSEPVTGRAEAWVWIVVGRLNVSRRPN